MTGIVLREAKVEDSEAIAEIYNQGIKERIATFETRARDKSDIAEWFDGIHPIVVAEIDGEVISFAATATYRQRECYSGIAEFSIYVKQGYRRMGAGGATLKKLIDEARERGFWKLISRVFAENDASLRLLQNLGFREVGIYRKHGKLDGSWKDVVIVEFLVEENIT